MANNGWHIVKALRKKGVDAHLIINSADFGMSLPLWEEMDALIDPYTVDFKKLLKTYDLPEWVSIWWHASIKENPLQIIKLFRMITKFDLLHLHPPSPIFLQFSNKPYVIHEAGWIRSLVKSNTPIEKLGRRSYNRANCVVWTNPDTFPLFNSLKCKRLEFIPFVINPEKYKPSKIEKDYELLFFHPTRQVYQDKGNWKLIQAFSTFIKDGYKATLRMVDWGYKEDVELTKKLIRKNNLEKHIEWVAPYTKPKLIKVYSECDAVFDQFILGSGGTVCYEAMSCASPVVIYLNNWNKLCFGEMPPVENARTINEIYQAMIRLTDHNYRKQRGACERKFTMKHNHPEVIAEKLLKVYREVYH